MHSQKKIGFWTLSMMIMGNLVGSGVFLIPATLAAFGSMCLLGWVSTSCGAIVLSLIFARLSFRTSHNRGPHSYVEESFGRQAGFFTAWSYWILSWVSNAGLVVGAIGYLAPLFGGFDKTTIFLFEMGLLLSLSSINLLGIQFVGKFEVFLTLCKITPLILLPLVGLFFIQFDGFLPFHQSSSSFISSLNQTAYLALWCFVGLETGTVPGDEVEKPHQNIPRALIFGTCLAAFIYMIGTISIMGVVPKEQLLQSKAPYADLARALLGGGSWARSISILAVIACVGALNGWIMVVTRIASGAADEGLFPKLFAIRLQNGAPLWGTIISSLCTMIFMTFSLSDNIMEQFNFVINLSLCLILFIYLACTLSYFKMLYDEKESIPFKDKFLILSGSLFCFWGICQCSLWMMIGAFILVICGYPFWIYCQKRSVTNPLG